MTPPFEQLFYVYDAGHRFGPPDSVYTPGRWPTPRVRPTVPPAVTREKLATTFYVSEIADAALVIVEKARLAGTYDIRLTLRDFEDPTGFLLLLNYGAGWNMVGAPDMLRSSQESPGEFRPTDYFWDRVVGMPQETPK